MQPSDKFKCGHLPGETLKATKKYDKHLYVVTSDETKRNYVAVDDGIENPHLLFAHISKEKTELHKI